MKKIRRLQDIREEKMRLRIRQLELEKQIKKNWKELKTEMKPSNIIKNKLEEAGGETGKNQSLWSAALDYGTVYLTEKLAAKAGHAAEARVKEGMETIANKVRKIFTRNKR